MQYLHRSSVINDEAVVYATHQHIAADLNVSREAISRLLKSMEKQGYARTQVQKELKSIALSDLDHRSQGCPTRTLRYIKIIRP